MSKILVTNKLREMVEAQVGKLQLPEVLRIPGLNRQEGSYVGHGWKLDHRDVWDPVGVGDGSYEGGIPVVWDRVYSARNFLWVELRPKVAGLHVKEEDIGEHDLQSVEVQIEESHELLPQCEGGEMVRVFGTLEELRQVRMTIRDVFGPTWM